MAGKKALFCLMGIILISFPSSLLEGDTIHLEDEKLLKGDVVKDGDDFLIMDIGFDVIRIPKERILKREEDSEEPSEGPEDVSTDQIYSAKKLKETSIKENVERFGEAVVLVSSPEGSGSGFIISEDGYVVTNYHVIERERKISVTVFIKKEKEFEKKKFDKVKIVALNPFVDLALLKIEELEGTKLKKVYLGSIDELKVGEKVFAIGSPMGLERSVSQGIVSTKNRDYHGLLFVQTTAPINPGNSGGPLFNLKGEVVGVNNMSYLFLDGLAFAIPVDCLKDFLDNRDAFAFDKDNPNTGYKYFEPPRRKEEK